MANLKKIKKTLVGLEEQELKEVLDFLTEDEEETVEETEEEIVEEEVKEEPKKEVKEDPQSKFIQMSKEDLENLISGIVSNFVTKEEVDEVKSEVNKVSKKAKPFGADKKKPKVEVKEEPKVEDYLAKLNSKFI
jgi:phage I-like protein